MDEFIKQLKEKVSRRIENANGIKEKKEIVETYCFSFPFLSADDFEHLLVETKHQIKEEVSFLDELKSIVKSPEEVKEARKKESEDFGIKCATTDYHKLKSQIIEAAKRNEYKIVGEKKIIECICNCSFWDTYYRTISPEKSIIGFKPAFSKKIGNIVFDRGIEYFIKDQLAYDAYNLTIAKKSKDDSIFVKIAAQYALKEQFPFPSVIQKAGNIDDTMGMSGHIEIVLVGRAEL